MMPGPAHPLRDAVKTRASPEQLARELDFVNSQHRVAFEVEDFPTKCWATADPVQGFGCNKLGTGRLGLCPQHVRELLP